MNVEEAVRWASERRLATLITLRRDGRAQSSDIVYRLLDGAFVISVTDGRAKTNNLRRDPRAVLHVSDPDSWSYVSFDGTAELSEVTTEPGDDTSDALVEYYRAVAGQDHDDWQEYRRAMVDERRLLITIRPQSAVGQIHGS